MGNTPPKTKPELTTNEYPELTKHKPGSIIRKRISGRQNCEVQLPPDVEQISAMRSMMWHTHTGLVSLYWRKMLAPLCGLESAEHIHSHPISPAGYKSSRAFVAAIKPAATNMVRKHSRQAVIDASMDNYEKALKHTRCYSPGRALWDWDAY